MPLQAQLSQDPGRYAYSLSRAAVPKPWQVLLLHLEGSYPNTLAGMTTAFRLQLSQDPGRYDQGRLTVNYRYTHRKFQLKFSALLKDYDLKYAENSKKNFTEPSYLF